MSASRPSARRRSALILALLALLALAPLGIGCGGGGGATSTSGNGTVTGRVLSPLGAPVAGASVLVVDGGVSGAARRAQISFATRAQATTRSDGTFSVPSPRGEHQLLVRIGSTILSRTTYTLAEFEVVELGDVAIDESQDADGDGLSDAVESIGWDILLNLSARRALSTRHVASSAALADTDGDGLSDLEEFASLCDPTRRDSDGDGLTDASEIRAYASNPTDVDTDEDAAGPDGRQLANPTLYDGNEVSRHKTSPTLEDTDGDGLTDYEEITGGGLDPRRADIATIALEQVGDPEIVLNFEKTTTDGRTSEAFVQRNDASTRTQVYNAGVTATQDLEYSFQQSGSFSPAPWKLLSLDVQNSQTYKFGFTESFSTTQTLDSRTENQQAWRDNVASSSEIRVKDGSLRVAFRVRNTSNRGILVADLSVLAQRVAPGSAGRPSVVGLLTPSVAFPPNVLLGPGGEFTFVAEHLGLNATTITEVIAKPAALTFEIANYTLYQVDGTGTVRRDYAALGERILERCATITVDFGDGRSTKALVAASVDRNEDGSSAGIGLQAALESILKLTPGTAEYTYVDATGATRSTGQQILWSLAEKGRASLAANTMNPASPAPAPAPIPAYWLVEVVSPNVAPVFKDGHVDADGNLLELPPNFGDIRILPGDLVTILYSKDSDRDGVSDRTEALFGTSPTIADSDGDGLSDDVEVLTGWDVTIDDPDDAANDFTYRVYSDARARDTDRDGVEDGVERTNGTDPSNADTDYDGVPDRDDGSPHEAVPGSTSLVEGIVVHYPIDRGADGRSGVVRTYLDSETLLAADRLTMSPGLVLDRRPTEFAGVYDGRDRFFAPNRAVRMIGTIDGTTTTWPIVTGPAPEILPTGTGASIAYTYALWFKPTVASFEHEMVLMGHAYKEQGPHIGISNGRYYVEVPFENPIDAEQSSGIPSRGLVSLKGRTISLNRPDEGGVFNDAFDHVLDGMSRKPDVWTFLAVVVRQTTKGMGVRVYQDGNSVGGEFTVYDAITSVDAANLTTFFLTYSGVAQAPMKPAPGSLQLGRVIAPSPGAPQYPGVYDFGSIDSVRVFDRALDGVDPTKDEINKLKNAR